MNRKLIKNDLVIRIAELLREENVDWEKVSEVYARLEEENDNSKRT